MMVRNNFIGERFQNSVPVRYDFCIYILIKKIGNKEFRSRFLFLKSQLLCQNSINNKIKQKRKIPMVLQRGFIIPCQRFKLVLLSQQTRCNEHICRFEF